MNARYMRSLLCGLGAAALATGAGAEPRQDFTWKTVVNNTIPMPGDAKERTFNSYNQPSVNRHGLVVIRARSRGGMGGGQPTHGIYTRDMADDASVVTRILDRTTVVPDPNNLGTTFVETPSFPRVDMNSNTIATRGNHQPAWRYVIGQDPGTGEDIETRAGTTGIYTNPFGSLITGAAKLGNVPDYGFFEVPEFPGTLFEVFPGSPSVTQGDTIVFKGNYTYDDVGRTGVYFRRLDNGFHGGHGPVVMIANNTDTLIPGTGTVFGSTAPPSAAGNKVVFAGFDDEDAPTLGGIYLARLQYSPRLTTLVSIDGPVPGESGNSRFNGLGEGGAFDGRFVGFWGAWGSQTKTVRLYCSTEGNKDRIAYCNRNLVCEGTDPPVVKEDTNSICPETPDPVYGNRCYQEREVPAHQGLFVHDIKTRQTWPVAKTGEDFDEFLYWNYSGKTPCTGGGHSEEGGEDDGESVRWRSSAFIAVSGRGATFKAAFKARTGDLDDKVWTNTVDGIYLASRPAAGRSPIMTVLDTETDGTTVDPAAPGGSKIIELGIEREGLRGNWLVINASMGVEGGEEEDGMAGVYITRLSNGNGSDDEDEDEY